VILWNPIFSHNKSFFLLYIHIVFIICLFIADDLPANVVNIPDIAGNNADIAVNIPDIAGNDADIAGNIPNIAGNDADIAVNNPDIAVNDADIAGNIPDIAGNDADIAVNNPGIAGNDADIAGNDSVIADDNPVIKVPVPPCSVPTRPWRCRRSRTGSPAAGGSGQRPGLCVQETPPPAQRQVAAYLPLQSVYMKWIL
jgi:hypothetical protein